MSLYKKLAPAALSLSLLASTAFAQEAPSNVDVEPANNNIQTQHFQCDMVAPASRHPLSIDPDVVEAVAPAVVYVQNKAEFRMPFGLTPETDIPVPMDTNPGNSLGSGYIVDPSGIVITNAHVVGGNLEGTEGRTFTITLYDPSNKDSLGEELQTTLIGIDDQDEIDIAVLQITGVAESRTFPCVNFADTTKLRLGEPVFAMGNPLGQTFSLSAGVISSVNRQMGYDNPLTGTIQTDAAINKGNSGGPLFTVNGEVVGMNTIILSPSGGSIGLGYAIPAETVISAANRIIEHGEIRRGWLGAGIEAISEQEAQSNNIDHGILLNNIEPNGPAAAAGLQKDDIVTSIDGVEVKDVLDLIRSISRHWPGETATIDIIRNGQSMSIDVEIGDRDAAPAAAQGPSGKDPGNGVIEPDERFQDQDDDAPEEDAPEDDTPSPQDNIPAAPGGPS